MQYFKKIHFISLICSEQTAHVQLAAASELKKKVVQLYIYS